MSKKAVKIALLCAGFFLVLFSFARNEAAEKIRYANHI